MRLVLLLLCLAPMWVAAVPPVVRDTSYDWRCVDSNFNSISNHQRQDRAIVSCQEQAEASPGHIFYVEGGRYRVISGAIASPPDPGEPDFEYVSSMPAADSIHPTLPPGTHIRAWVDRGVAVQVSDSGGTLSGSMPWGVSWSYLQSNGQWSSVNRVIWE